jgi:hypothetical protein
MALWASFRVRVLLRLSGDGSGFDAFSDVGRRSLLVLHIGEGMLVGELRFIFAECVRFVSFFLVCGGGGLLGWFFVRVQASFCSLRAISVEGFAELFFRSSCQ